MNSTTNKKIKLYQAQAQLRVPQRKNNN